MPATVLDGITTRYEVVGSGPPLLMLSPGGFEATVESWSTTGIYRRLGLVDRLAARHTCILFDRREAGRSGGRVERVRWQHYVAQAHALLSHLGIGRASVIGACAGCSTAVALAVDHPEAVAALVLYAPAGGARYRIKQQARFARHVAYVLDAGLDAVVTLARADGRSFSQDSRVGPWAPVLRRDDGFADAYRGLDRDRYAATVTAMGRELFDRDTVAGAEAEDLLALEVPALVVPGDDDSHATSAARYLAECLPGSQYWAAPISEQTAATAAARILDFLSTVPTS